MLDLKTLHHHHENNGKCQKCEDIFNVFAGFHEPLKVWFFALQANEPRVHISCAGRGKVEQEACVLRGASDAHYPKSGHNLNAAIDTFFIMKTGDSASWPTDAYDASVLPKITSDLNWYGHPNIRFLAPSVRRKQELFYELPHIEWKVWRDMAKRGELREVQENVALKSA